MREAQFEVQSEIPRGPRAKWDFKCYLVSLVQQIGRFGEEGQDVGIGFIWYTRSGLVDININTLSNRMTRALISTMLLSRRATPYHLEQRVQYIRDGEPHAIFTIREGVKKEEK